MKRSAIMKAKTSNNSDHKKSKSSKEKKGETSKSHSHRNIGIKSFKFLKKLGTGAQANVYMVEKVDGPDKGEIYALKVYPKSRIQGNGPVTDFIKNERMILEKIVDCPFLTTMAYAFQSSDYLYIALKFAQGGEMFSILRGRPFSTDEAKFYMAEIILAIEDLHKHNILYRDLKLENILLDKDGHVVVLDFGLSLDITQIENQDVARIAGTLQYMPPEAFDTSMPYGFAVDWWATGILFHEMLTQKTPYTNFNADLETDDPEKMKEMLDNAVLTFDKDLDENARDLIQKLLVKDVTLRLGSKNGVADLKEHPFFSEIDWDAIVKKEFAAPIKIQFADKYDAKSFDDEFTNETFEFVDNSSQNYKSKTFSNFSFIAPGLSTRKRGSSSASQQPAEKKIKDEPMEVAVINYKPMEVTKMKDKPMKNGEIKKEPQTPSDAHEEWNTLFLKFTQKIKANYIPNNLRASMILERHFYKK